MASRGSSARSKSTLSSELTGADYTLIIHEQLDLDMVSLLLQSAKLRQLKNDEGGSMFDAYSRLFHLAQHLGGSVPVRYTVPTSGFGRYMSQVAIDDRQVFMMSLTIMKREVRALLAAKHYLDVDFVNCHPVILEQQLGFHSIPCPLLTRYISGRDACLTEVSDACGVSRDDAKNLFIRLVFLGGVGSWISDASASAPPPSWVYQLHDELRDNAERLVGSPELDDIRRCRVKGGAARRPLDTPTLASVLSIHLQTLERRCLDALHDAITRDGFTVGPLIYDGLLVLKSDLPGGADESTLKNWRAHVLCAAGFDLELKVKPFDIDRSWLEPDPSAPLLDGLDAKWDDSWMDGSHIMSYGDMKKLWEQRSFKVTVCGEFAREELEKHIVVYSRNKFVEAYEHLTYSEILYDSAGGVGRVKKKPFIKAWVADASLRKYKYMDTFPPPLICPPNTYNTWIGFAISRYQPPTGSVVDVGSPGVLAFISHLRTLLKHDNASTDYVLDWIAQIFQEPSRKTGIALLFKGAEGVGKNRLTDLLNLMLGDGLFLETANPGSVLFGRFTDARRGRFLIVINEASGADNHAANDLLKDMITSERFVWEAKGRDGMQMRAYDRFIFTTNNSNCLKINPDSRRYVVFEVSSELKGNTAYFTELSRFIASEQARFEFFTFLMQRDISRVDWINSRPLTQYYNRMVEINIPREYEFLRDIVILPAYMLAIPVVERCSSELFQEFKQWLDSSSSKTYATTSTKFGSRLSDLVSGSDVLPGVSKPRRRAFRAYAFDVDVVVDAMVIRKWVSSEDLPIRSF